MKQNQSFSIYRPALLALTIIACASLPGRSAASSPRQYPQQQPQNQAAPKPQTSNDELEDGKKVEAAADAASRLQAAGEFVKKYPKSNLMDTVAKLVAAKIAETPDPNQKAAFCETFLTLFQGTPQARVIYPIEIEAYSSANKPDDALRVEQRELDESLAGLASQQNPDDVQLLTRVVSLGIELVKRNNPKYVGPVQQYGAKAIQLIEADKKPADLSDSSWADYKTKVLPQIYQSLGLIALMLQKQDEAKPKLEKAIQLNPSDAFSYYLLGTISDNQYQATYQKYKGMTAGAEREATLNKALEQMDQTIDLFAHAVALSEGNPNTQALHDRAIQDLQLYYNFRHKDKGPAGMQELINKYKKPNAASSD
jgi:tetratricopeptide (TPR) repeat protein